MNINQNKYQTRCQSGRKRDQKRPLLIKADTKSAIIVEFFNSLSQQRTLLLQLQSNRFGLTLSLVTILLSQLPANTY